VQLDKPVFSPKLS